MKLRIANLGVIKEATIDLSKKLTVFCGPNGTGKTWAAYALQGYLDDGAARSYSGPQPDFTAFAVGAAVEIDIPAELVFETMQADTQIFQARIQDIFPVAAEQREALFATTTIHLALSEAAFVANYISSRIETTIDFLDFKAAVSKDAGDTVVKLQKISTNDKITLSQGILTSIFTAQLVHTLGRSPIGTVNVLPVERNSVFTFHKELNLQNAALAERFKTMNPEEFYNAWAEFNASRNIQYPLAIREALQVADRVGIIRNNASVYLPFAQEVESDLLKGKVSVSDSGEVAFATNLAQGKSFSFQLSSSAVKTISSLIIYLKYQAKPNELLIIDEPELNLHPDNQILLARIFARMINKGIHLLISTHSDYIIRELNNLIMLSGNTPALNKVAKEFHYADDERISRDDIGVYLFHFKNPQDSHVTVEPVEVADNGFEVATIEETINKLNAASEEIFYTMKYGEQVHDGDSKAN